ncbi:MAG TPA: zinc ribbon domain-containing protein, partial [Blastocatellia bacterium]|nr:zinc ribbon domain-containing protein [Blastocatellia bacterium]
MEELFWLLLIIGAVTLIGHGIWVVLAAFFRAFFGEPERKPVELQLRCVACGTELQFGDDFCPACGCHQKTAEASPLAELATTARQLDRLLNQGKLDATTHQAVMKAIGEDRERLIRPQRPALVVETPPPAVVEPEPISEPVSSLAPIEPPPAFNAPAFNVMDHRAGSRVDAMIRQEAEPPAPAIPVAPVNVEPRRSLTEMLETFMEESSIRWGELIGGLLIIGCSLALVVSLWAQITAVPLLKFSVFVGMTAGLFGMGFY